METNLKLQNFILNNKRSLISGIEGSGKSTQTLDALLSTDNKIVFACASYYQLIEKQQWVMQNYNLTKYQCPIVAEALTDTNYNYLTLKSNPSAIPDEARVIFCTHTFITKEHAKNHKDLQDAILVIDECRVDMLLLGGTDALLFENAQEILDIDNYSNFDQKLSKYSKFKYGKQDSRLIMNQFISKNAAPFCRAWLDTKQKIVFLTSEKLMSSILKTPAFNFQELNLSDGVKHSGKFFAVHSSQVTKEFYQVMNELNGWDKLSNKFDLIISDSVNQDEVAISHTKAMGSNEYMDKTILSIVSQIPKQSLSKIADMVNKIHNGQKIFSEKEIYALFYRDRICQAVGRNVGYRGTGPHFVIINTQIWETIKELYNDLEFPVAYSAWQEDEYTQHVDKHVKIAREIEEEKRNKVRLNTKEKHERLLRDQIVENFRLDSTSRLTKIELDKLNLTKPNGIKMKLSDIAEHFNLPAPKQCKTNGIKTLCIDGVKIR